MSLRYTVRLQPDNRLYCVWDNEHSKIAVYPDGRGYDDLTLSDAFDIASELNIQDNRSKGK